MSESAAPDRQADSFDPVKEIRFAVVIYGGVSLAIYINGIVQEMLKLVRATAPLKDLRSDRPLLNATGASGLKSTEKIYRKLGQILNDPDLPPAALLEQVEKGIEKPIRTRFVIDILSGTSAGGINAIFLGKALANNQELEDLHNLWISEGDISSLINDRGSLKAPLVPQNPPQSLLNSNRMYLELLKAMDGMDTKKPVEGSNSPLVERLDLFSTTTDIRGLTMPITLTDGVVYERRHRNVFHFQHPAVNPAEQTDFRQDNNPFLAYAARCTSAFPFAFEPMELSDVFPIVNTAPLHMGKLYCDPDSHYWERFYKDYTRAQNTAPRTQPFHFRAFGDGGYLDNKPFSYAIDTTLTRHADLPMERKLIYIEPSPEELTVEQIVARRPDAIENSLAALLVLPRYETIREDLERVINRNVEIERVNRVVNDVQTMLSAPRSGDQPDSWIGSSQNAHGVGYATYERLKLSAVTDELADLLSVQFRVDTGDAFGSAIRTLASEWRQLEYPDIVDQRRFLLAFDVQFRLRRIRYVRRRIQEEYAEPNIPPNLPAESVRGYLNDYREEMRTIKASLGSPYLALQSLLAAPVAGTVQAFGDVFTGAQLTLVAAPPTDLATWPGLPDYKYVSENSERGARRRAVYVLQVLGARPRVTALAGLLAERFKTVMIDASDAIRASFEDSPKLIKPAQDGRAFVRREYERFEGYDSAAYPITFGTDVDDNGPISIHRISPDDATARRDDTLVGRTKLRGQTSGAFGAFLDATWRKNDILWGRLDGAERLIQMVLPGSDKLTGELRQKLIDQAHEEIVNETLTDANLAHLDWNAKLREFVGKVPAEPDPALMARSAARSTAVVGDLLEGIADARMAKAKPLFSRVAFIGRVCWSFIEVSVPRTLGELFGTYWMQLSMLFAGMLILLAVITAEAGVTRLAIIATTVVTALYVLRESLRRYLRGVVVLAPAVLVIITVLITCVVTTLIVYFSTVSVSLYDANDHIGWPSWGDLRATARDYEWILPFMASSSVVAALSGILTINAAHRARVLRPGVNVIGKLKFARCWNDIFGALGTPDWLSADDGIANLNLDAAGQAAVRRSSVVRAASIREAAIQTVRRDYVFAAAYALVFVSTSLWLITRDWSAVASQIACDAAVGFLGVTAFAMNFKVNDRIIQALTSNPPQDARAPVSEAPYWYNVGKWIAVAAACCCVAIAAFEPQWLRME